jgi:hypothetical protein
MTLIQLWLIFLMCCLSGNVRCIPLPLSDERPSRDQQEKRIQQQQLYQNMTLQEVPTKVAEDAFLTNYTSTRYGYHMGRPVDRLFRHPVTRVLKPVLANIMSDMPSIQHWGILISTEPPFPFNTTHVLPEPGSKVPSPKTGLIYELRNSVNTGLVYLDLKNWTTYSWHYSEMRYLGTLNKTDEELITLGRAYIQHIGKEGFHNFYRNCQHFTTWYSKALWPEVTLTQRADQLFGKALWWIRDMKKTREWGWNKVKGWFGLSVATLEAVDSAAEFVKLEDVLTLSSGVATKEEVEPMD